LRNMNQTMKTVSPDYHPKTYILFLDSPHSASKNEYELE
jgi:hypothetical protein